MTKTLKQEVARIKNIIAAKHIIAEKLNLKPEQIVLTEETKKLFSDPTLKISFTIRGSNKVESEQVAIRKFNW